MKHKKTTLKNGLRIITVPMKEAQTAIGMVLVETGSHYEEERINGLSHFLEHMCFKGTASRTGDDIKSELDNMGAESNAFTGFEYTGYYAKAHHKKIGNIINLVSDIYLNSTFPKKDIEIERGVITEEINMYEDLPSRTVWDIWSELLFPNQPAGRTILGPKKNIQSLKQQDFIDYYKKHYVPKKTVVVIAGNINQTDVLKQIKKIFNDIPSGKMIKKEKVIEKQKSPQIKIRYKKTDQTHLIIGFRAFDLKDKRSAKANLMATVLGKGFSSRLFKRMRDELGMCYYTRADLDSLSDHGYFVVSSGVGNKRAEEAVEVIIDEYRKLKEELISDKELCKAKEFSTGRLAIGLETSDSIADFYGFQELHHLDIKSPREKIKKVKEVNSKDIQKLAKQIFTNDRLNLAIVGPFKDDRKFKKLLKIK